MDGQRFDQLARALGAGRSRRQVLRGLLGLGGAAVAGTVLLDESDARTAGTRPTLPPPPPPAPSPTSTPTPTPTPAPRCLGYTCGLDCCDEEIQCCDGECCPAGSSCLARLFPESPYIEEETCCPAERVCDTETIKCCPEGERCCDSQCLNTDLCCTDADCGDPCLVCSDDRICVQKCDPSSTCCGGDCVDTSADEQHCGACDAPCGTGTICDDGSCIACTADFDSCSSFEECCSGFCMHYGASGSQCEPCEATICPGGICADLTSNDFNCGTCGNECPDGTGCREGSCQNCRRSGEACAGGDCCGASDYCYDFGSVKLCATCFGPRVLCGEVCCNTDDVCCPDGTYCSALSDDANCGACGASCAANEHCYGDTCSACVPQSYECNANTDCCSGFCAFLGTAGTSCEVCEHTICGNFICADLDNNDQHCGACHNQCPSGAICQNGQCVA